MWIASFILSWKLVGAWSRIWKQSAEHKARQCSEFCRCLKTWEALSLTRCSRTFPYPRSRPCEFGEKPYDYLLIIQTWKKSRRKIAGRCFLKPFFRIRENFFQSFRTKFLSLLCIISLPYKISHCLSSNHYPEERCVICTGVTLELHCSQPIRIE